MSDDPQPDELDIYQRQGFGHRIGFGDRPALVIVDFMNAFADPEILGGGNLPQAIDNTEALLARAREMALPIVHTRQVYAADGSDFNLFADKIPAAAEMTPDRPETQIVDTLTPEPGEYVVDKPFASAFFGTDLAAWLALRRVDTLMVAGCTTSGCIRATVVDAMCHGLRPMVVRDCVGDRSDAAHRANLFDMDQKYADVMSSNEVYAALADLASDD